MSHKQTCANNCKNYLASISLHKFYSDADFESYYRKHNGSKANAYKFGLDVADYIIREKKISFKDAS